MRGKLSSWASWQEWKQALQRVWLDKARICPPVPVRDHIKSSQCYFNLNNTMEVSNPTGHTSNLWGKCPLYGCNAMGRLISWEIHYKPLSFEGGLAWDGALSKHGSEALVLFRDSSFPWKAVVQTSWLDCSLYHGWVGDVPIWFQTGEQVIFFQLWGKNAWDAWPNLWRVLD